MNWFANSEHNYSHDQLSVVTRKDTPCPMKNTSYFSCDVSEDTNNSEVTFDLPHWTFLQHQCQGYMHQKQENISRNQEYEMKYETSQSITANKFDDRLNYCGTYPDRNISAVVSLQEALQSQFIKVKRTPMTNDVTGSWYLLDGEVDSKRRGFQENYSRQSPISIKDIRFGPSLISHNEYSLQSYFFGHPIDTGLQKAEMTHQQPQSFDCSTSPSTQGSIKQEKLDKSPKLQNNVVIQKQSLICRWKSCNLIFTDHKSFVNHIEASHVASHISNKEYCCYWEGCRRQLKPFNARYKLIVHLRIHNGDRPSKCLYPDCYKAFSRLENLKIHMRSHTGERPFICQQDGCNRAFSNSSDRAKHQRTHIHIKPYVCKVFGCTKRYTDPSSLRKHSKSHSIYEFSMQSGDHVLREQRLKDNNLSTLTTSCSSQENMYVQSYIADTKAIKNDVCHFLTYNLEKNISHNPNDPNDNRTPLDFTQNNSQFITSPGTNAQPSISMDYNNNLTCSCAWSHQNAVSLHSQLESDCCFNGPTLWKDNLTPVVFQPTWNENVATTQYSKLVEQNNRDEFLHAPWAFSYSVNMNSKHSEEPRSRITNSF